MLNNNKNNNNSKKSFLNISFNEGKKPSHFFTVTEIKWKK